MVELLDPKNWTNLIVAGNRLGAVVILILAGAALLGSFYRDTFQLWRGLRGERPKELPQNRW